MDKRKNNGGWRGKITSLGNLQQKGRANLTRRYPSRNPSPIVRLMFEFLDRDDRTYSALSTKSGLNHGTITRWRYTNHSPRVILLEYCLETIGHKLAIVPIDEPTKGPCPTSPFMLWWNELEENMHPAIMEAKARAESTFTIALDLFERKYGKCSSDEAYEKRVTTILENIEKFFQKEIENERRA